MDGLMSVTGPPKRKAAQAAQRKFKCEDTNTPEAGDDYYNESFEPGPMPKKAKTKSKADAVSNAPSNATVKKSAAEPKKGKKDAAKKPIATKKPCTTKVPFKEEQPEAPHEKDDILDVDDLNHDPELLDIVNAMTARVPLGEKPLPMTAPPIWAASRQELCETLPYYQSYHAGCYMNSGSVFSFMLDGEAQLREFMGEEVIICRAGGCMEAQGKTMVQAKNQSLSDTQPAALLNNIRQQRPVVIICGDRNTASPSRMPYKFCVLGWFKPTHIWCDRIIGKGGRFMSSVRYRFERLNATRRPWYAPVSQPAKEPAALRMQGIKMCQCHTCGKESPEMFLCGWMCLNGTCQSFWKLVGSKVPPIESVVYHPAFLTCQVSWTCEESPFALAPSIPQGTSGFDYANTRGIVCQGCGRCLQRYLFTSWRCDSCGWTLQPERRPILSEALYDTSWQQDAFHCSHAVTTSKSVVKVEVGCSHGYKVFRYTIPGINGCIIHARAGLVVRKEACGPDEMFQTLQTEDCGLVRREFRSHPKIAGIDDQQDPLGLNLRATPAEVDEPEAVNQAQLEALGEHSSDHLDSGSSALLGATSSSDSSVEAQSAVVESQTTVEGRMQSFSMSFGMPYKFTGSGESVSFEGAAWPVQAGRSRLDWAVRTFAGVPDSAFNELLLIAYMEKQKIAFHDDGEAGLGHTVASLSLGSTSTMSLRMKGKYFSGVSKQGLFVMSEPLPLAVLQACSNSKNVLSEQLYRARKTAFRALSRDSHNLHQRCRETASQLGLKHHLAQPLIELHVGHGDIVIMQGADLQKYFEHAVEPHGKLRFAMTCRTILPDHLADEKLSYSVGPDTFCYDGSQIKNKDDGDVLIWTDVVS